MTESAYQSPPVATKRPGGLTALAVLNIVFAFVGMLGGAALHVINQDRSGFAQQADQMDIAADRMARDNSNGGNPEMNRAIAHGMAMQMRVSSPEAFRWMFAAGMTGGLLLLISGIGFLGQRRLMGRHVATGAGIALFACGAIAMTKLGFMFWGFPMLGAGYASVMVLLVHFAYRPALQR